MDTQTKELIAIGASVTGNCLPCLQFHLKKVRETGVDEAEIHTAINIGRMVRKGAASKWDEEAEALLGSGPTPVTIEQKDQTQKSGGCS